MTSPATSTPAQSRHAGPAVRHVYRFEGFEFCDMPLRLTRGGAVVKVRPQSLRILAKLLSSVGRPVSMQALIDTVWPDGGGDEGSIRVAVAHLRAALRGSTEKCVETIRGQGYRFVQPVEIEQQELVRTRRLDLGV